MAETIRKKAMRAWTQQCDVVVVGANSGTAKGVIVSIHTDTNVVDLRTCDNLLGYHFCDLVDIRFVDGQAEEERYRAERKEWASKSRKEHGFPELVGKCGLKKRPQCHMIEGYWCDDKGCREYRTTEESLRDKLQSAMLSKRPVRVMWQRGNGAGKEEGIIYETMTNGFKFKDDERKHDYAYMVSVELLAEDDAEYPPPDVDKNPLAGIKDQIERLDDRVNMLEAYSNNPAPPQGEPPDVAKERWCQVVGSRDIYLTPDSDMPLVSVITATDAQMKVATAAPDMLDMLEEASPYITITAGSDLPARIQAVIKKARGEDEMGTSWAETVIRSWR